MEDAAVALANDSVDGLAVSVRADDLRRAIGLPAGLHAGTVSVNPVDALSAQGPFGGRTQTGLGRDQSRHAPDKGTALKITRIACRP